MRNIDWISTLPDYVISDMILSLLPTKQSVQTSVLSSRWKHLYASVPVIDLEYRSRIQSVVSNFLNRLPRISKFRLYYYDCEEDLDATVNNSDIISWIDTATSRHVQQIDLDLFRVQDGATTPRSLFTCQTLVSLSLSVNFVFSVPDIVCLPNLKVLVLKDLFRDESDDESFTRLISGCPVLEKLAVFSTSMDLDARVLNVSVPSLKFLRLCLWYTEVELLINCPNLEGLSCECYGLRGYSGDVLGSLKICYIKVDLIGDEFEDGNLIELVRRVCKVRTLSLDGDSMQALLFARGSMPIFEYLTHLELKSIDLKGWELLPSILNSSPHLKTLDLVNGFCDFENNFENPYLPPPEHVPVCLSFRLKVIKIGRFMGEENEYKWVEYFLTNALVLKKMEICLWSSAEGEREGEGEGEVLEEEEEFDSNLEKYFAISKRLLAFQRLSKGCRIILTSSHHY